MAFLAGLASSLLPKVLDIGKKFIGGGISKVLGGSPAPKAVEAPQNNIMPAGIMNPDAISNMGYYRPEVMRRPEPMRIDDVRDTRPADNLDAIGGERRYRRYFDNDNEDEYERPPPPRRKKGKKKRRTVYY